MHNIIFIIIYIYKKMTGKPIFDIRLACTLLSIH